MKTIYDAQLIQIEVTNVCNMGRANYTRLVGHHKKPYFMDLGFREKTIDSLGGFKGGIGIVSEEPIIHTQSVEICKAIKRKGLTCKAGIRTSGYKMDEIQENKKGTFNLVVWFNGLSGLRRRYQPTLVAVKEVARDKKLMWMLIDDRWAEEALSPPFELPRSK